MNAVMQNNNYIIFRNLRGRSSRSCRKAKKWKCKSEAATTDTRWRLKIESSHINWREQKWFNEKGVCQC
jgi:hypothetical protein